MKKRKTKGSSMLFVIIVFGIISILGVSIMGVTYSNYSSRIAQNNKVKDLYSAESGLDMAYIKLCSEVQNGINEGVNAVNILLAANSNTTIVKQNDKLKEEYTKYICGNVVENVSGEYNIATGKADIICELYDKEDKEKNLTEELNDKVAVLTSTFSDLYGNKRIVKVSYILSLPENVIEINGTEGNRSEIASYSIASDENMEIKSTGSLEVNGNVWVKGLKSIKDELSTNTLERKYAGGIIVDSISSSGKVKFSGNLTTNSNIVVKNGSISVGRGRDVYAENLYLGSLNSSEDEDNNITFESEDLYLANDLVIADSDSQVYLKNLYAFNDLNSAPSINTNGNEDGVEDEIVARESSSIIINSLKWPNTNGKIEVSDSAYIMGLAYIKTNSSPYQTGESVAYKGNYQAYTNSMESGLLDGQYTYLDPLVLLTHNISGKELTAWDKTERFIKYSESSNKDKLRTSGIILPDGKTYTAGAYISGNSVFANNITVDVSEELNKMKTDYIKNVNYMGEEGKEISNSNLSSEFMTLPSSTVNGEINWDGVRSLIKYKGNAFEESDIVFVLNNDKNKSIIVQGDKIKLGGSEVAVISIGKKYVIVSSGDVKFNSGASDYDGAVFTTGNIIVEKTSGDIGCIGGVETIYDSTDDDGKKILDIIFNDGDTIITTKAITSSDIIQRGKWSIEK